MQGWSGRKTRQVRELVVSHYGNRCSLCGRPVDLDVRAPHPMSFAIEHVLPRSLGGSDHIENLRPAHKRCNEQKGNRIDHIPRRPFAAPGWLS